MNWGHGIAIFFVCFVTFMLVLVVKAFQENIDLVTENYYQEELDYQTRIDKIKNNQLLIVPVEVTSEQGGINIQFPELGSPITGKIQVFRPSDAQFDLIRDVDPDIYYRQHISTSALPGGFYKIKISWEAEGMEYYTEESVNLY
ncbi:FixH family protein [Anditalea andensis]|uniref:Nitrogen fixation protein FixH n=1 Tax=Anditalea andensis TaxID=1048983 RepID=A0A074LMY8_9BACT|nr:FixH family protein [Anditalea andensis]KEO75262.1 hypothetical protein EL17_01610 [Anditalea andensis]